ncbi:MAG: MMPL family transporter [Phycisphaerales bacterium]|nr:MMPL family transporter [Phycisphaerales bacterium]
MHERIRDSLLGVWGRTVAARPGVTLAIALFITVGAVVLTQQHLEFRSDRSDLIDPGLSWNRRYALYKDRFERWDDLIVCLEGPPGDVAVDALGRAIAQELVSDPRIRAADAGFEVQETGPRLFAAAPEPMFSEALDGLARGRLLTAAPNAASMVALLTGAGEEGPPGDPGSLAAALDPILTALEGGEPDFSRLRPDQPRWLPLVSAAGSGRIRFVYVQLATQSGGVDDLSRDLAWVRQTIRDAVARSGRTDVEFGVTGIPAIEADETAQSIRDSTIASILAFSLITLLMVAVFRGVVVPLLAATALLVGMAWSFGWLVVAVGHLQLLSVVFSVILLGLGVDFALHLVSRLELVQDEHADLPSATARVFRGIGPGMLTGAITTAAAFGATALTQFKGMAEMGIIAGGGIVLCLIAVLSVFPATLAATRRWKSIVRHRPGGERARFAYGRLDVVDFHPRAMLLVGALAVLLLGLPGLRTRYDPNVLNLHPPGIESVEWERRIVEEDAQSVWAALVQTTPEQAPALADRFRALPSVSGVGGMGLLLPPDRDERAARIAATRATPLPAIALRDDFAALRGVLTTLRDTLPPDDATSGLGPRIDAALATAHALPPDEQTRRMTHLRAAFDQWRHALGSWVEVALAPVPLGADDLPPALRAQWSDGDTWLLQIFPRVDPAGRSILHPARLGAFVEELRGVDERVLGPPVQIYESSELIKREYTKAAVYAIAAIFILLLLDFRSLADTLSAMLPVTIGFIGCFGLMGLFDVPLNFANIIVMPLIFGIGVDAGVHVVHRWRSEPYGRPAGLSGGTGRGITLTMISTMIGFGSMLLAEHRGIRSLGFVMLAGLSVCLVACYTLLPAVLRLRTTR